MTVMFRCLSRRMPLPHWGNLRRTVPFSTEFGFDRGTPIDRYYLREFFDKNREWITGNILEIQMSGFTHEFGHNIQSAHSVDINPAVSPTFICDLADSQDVIPDNSYDCFLLPSTLQHMRDIEGCLRHALRIIKPGGVILASAAGFIPLIPDGPDYWRLSAAGWTQIVARVWPECEVRIESHGNCLAATAALYGLALEELSPTELDIVDARYPVLTTLYCRKT